MNSDHELNTLCYFTILSWLTSINEIILERIPGITGKLLEMIYDILTLRTILENESSKSDLEETSLKSDFAIILDHLVEYKMNWVENKTTITTTIDKIHRQINCQPCSECSRINLLPDNIQEELQGAIHCVKFWIYKLDHLSKILEPLMVALCGDDLTIFDSSQDTSDINDIMFQIVKRKTPSNDTMDGIEEIQDMEELNLPTENSESKL